ncbi:MAG: L-serine ammonia-lyase, iron-sulfur-dependent subunit beta [Bacteroidia bacterium]|nr:L-serine ammonia-lyase, iron-sulfur-dependent subunit beta [Bacteroidia bacterium]
MAERSSIFDMIGPVMIGPSSSHTAGVVRIGRTARRLLGAQPEQAVVTFYNSFSRTYEGHGSDRAIVAGLMDMNPDDIRIKTSLELAQSLGLQVTFKAVFNASDLHANSVRVQMTLGDRQMQILGISRGGGLISIVSIDGFACNFTAQNQTLVISARDVHGSVAFISSVIAQESCNIATLTVNRSGKNDTARLVFELDSGIRPLTLDYLRSLGWVEEVIYLEKPED